MPTSVRPPLGYPVTTRIISWEQTVRDAEGARWDLPIGKYFFGDQDQYVFVSYDDSIKDPVLNPDFIFDAAPAASSSTPLPAGDYCVAFVSTPGSCSSVSLITTNGGNVLVAYNGGNNYTDYVSYSTGTTANLYSACVGNAQFIVGAGGTILSSQLSPYDEEFGATVPSFYTETSNTVADLYGVASIGSYFCAFGEGGTLVVNNGSGGNPYIPWLVRNTGTTKTLRSAVYDEDYEGIAYAVIVGDAGTIIYTLKNSDLSSWTSTASPTTKNLRAIGQNNWYQDGYVMVAVGDGGTIITSPDQITWTSTRSGTTENLYGICYESNSSAFYAVGSNGTIITSPDGFTWSAVTSPVTNDLYSIAYSPEGQIVAVGAGGVQINSNYPYDTWTVVTS